MTLYATDRMVWEATADIELARRLREDPATVLAGRDLTDAERAALADGDIRALFQLGVHPFLLYHFALRLAGGFSLDFVASYLQQLDGLTVGDLET